MVSISAILSERIEGDRVEGGLRVKHHDKGVTVRDDQDREDELQRAFLITGIAIKHQRAQLVEVDMNPTLYVVVIVDIRGYNDDFRFPQTMTPPKEEAFDVAFEEVLFVGLILI